MKLRDEAEEELLQCDGQFVAHLPKPRLRYGEDQYRVVRRFPIAEDPACMPAVTRAPNGDLLVAFSTQWEPFPAGGVLKLVVSEDNGRSWSQPRVLWQHEDPRVTIQVGNGLQTLSNGDVLLPVNYCLYPQRDDVPAGEQRPSRIYDLSSPNKVREVRLLRSADSGRSWTIEDPKIGAPWFGRLLETKVAETKETRLIMTGGGWYVESRDHGHTWGPRVSLGTPFYQETNLVQAADGTLFFHPASVGRPGTAPHIRHQFFARRRPDVGQVAIDDCPRKDARLAGAAQRTHPDGCRHGRTQRRQPTHQPRRTATRSLPCSSATTTVKPGNATSRWSRSIPAAASRQLTAPVCVCSTTVRSWPLRRLWIATGPEIRCMAIVLECRSWGT